MSVKNASTRLSTALISSTWNARGLRIGFQLAEEAPDSVVTGCRTFERRRRGDELNLGRGKLQICLYVASVERRQGTPHDLHVLLRHRLLRQPRGFEGFLLVPEGLLSHHPLALEA